MRTIRTVTVAFALYLVTSLATSAQATMLLRRPSLEDVVTRAERVVGGRVVAVRTGRDQRGLPATWITLDVFQTLKGPAATQLTFKQAGVAEPLADGGFFRIPGIPTFTEGEEVILCLRGESPRGFTSPVGFESGTFRVV